MPDSICVRLAAKSSGGWNRTNGLLVQSQASLPAATTPDRRCSGHVQITRQARGEGIEPSLPGSKPGGLPLADPRSQRVPCGSRTHLASLEGWNLCRSAKGTCFLLRRKGGSRTLKAVTLDRFRGGCHRQSACPSVLSSSGGRNRTSNQGGLTGRRLTNTATPDQSVRTAGFEPAISCSRSTRNTRLSYVLSSRPCKRKSVGPNHGNRTRNTSA